MYSKDKLVNLRNTYRSHMAEKEVVDANRSLDFEAQRKLEVIDVSDGYDAVVVLGSKQALKEHVTRNNMRVFLNKIRSINHLSAEIHCYDKDTLEPVKTLSVSGVRHKRDWMGETYTHYFFKVT